jgi:hypothetical protein
MSNEDRLARESIEHFDRSRTADGLTQSRYPTRDPQYIPPYSLFWVGMVHDFWMYRDDDAFVRARLPGTRAVIDWFLRRLRPDGLLAWIPFWSHVDPDAGGARQTEDGGSAAVTAQLLPALREAAALEEALGDRGRAALYRAQAQKIVVGLRTLWDPARGLLRDHPGATTYSHDANLLALWEGVMTGPARGKLLDSVLAIGRNPPGRRRERPEGEVVPASLYFRFYLHRALDRAGRGDELLPLLAPWREMLGLGLTTFPEFTDPTRSDSHAWTAHPAYDFLTILAGIRPGAPGFKRVRIAPALGTLGRLEATMPHPRGAIAVAYRRTGETIEAKVTLPPGLPGELVAGGKTVSLAAGETRVLTWRAPRAAAAPAPRAER